MKSAYQALFVRTGGWLEPLALLGLRLAGAKVFVQSGMTKWNGFLEFNQDKYHLFLYEFFCPDPPRPGALRLCDPATLDYTEGSAIVAAIKALAVTAGVVEIVLPVMLIAGLLSRLSALGLFGMTLFIQFRGLSDLEPLVESRHVVGGRAARPGRVRSRSMVARSRAGSGTQARRVAPMDTERSRRYVDGNRDGFAKWGESRS